jgi:hypothetical protein
VSLVFLILLNKTGLQRKNMSIVETTLCMLEQFGMPCYLWVEACNTIVHIMNRCLMSH